MDESIMKQPYQSSTFCRVSLSWQHRAFHEDCGCAVCATALQALRYMCDAEPQTTWHEQCDSKFNSIAMIMAMACFR